MQRDGEMESEAGAGGGPAGGKSKLDSLSKEDLIQFTKKQIGVIQKMKTKCAGLESEVAVLKSSVSSDATVIQELTQRIDAVLLEKAESQQCLTLLRKQHEQLKKKAEEAERNSSALQEELDRSGQKQAEKIRLMQKELETSKAKLREEVETFRKLQNEKKQSEENERQKLQEQFNSDLTLLRQRYENHISSLQLELEEARAVHQEHQKGDLERLRGELERSEREAGRLQGELERLGQQHEEELRELEEQLEVNTAHFEMERERLLLLHEELTEQLALKETHLQDVQEEEDEDTIRAQRADETNLAPSDSTGAQEPTDEADRLRQKLQDLHSHNSLLEEELTFLRNVKAELENDLQHVREEFHAEREEMEFKINELQMSKEEQTCRNRQDGSTRDEVKSGTPVETMGRTKELSELQEHLEAERENAERELKDLREKCQALLEERNVALEECEQTKELLRSLETELRERTADFEKRCDAMKEERGKELEQHLEAERANVDGQIKELQEKCQVLLEEKNTALSEYERTKVILKTLETELGERMEDFVKRYNEMKEEARALKAQLEAEQCNSEQEMKEHQETCQTLLDEKNTALAEHGHAKEALKTLETELGERVAEFEKRYRAMKEEAAKELEQLLEAERRKSEAELNLLQEKCQALLEEKTAALAECEHTKEILRNLETELGERTTEFEKRCDAVKEEGTKELQEQLEAERRNMEGVINQLQEKCQALLEGKNTTLAEHEHTKEILRNLETELRQQNANFESRYNASKEETRELQERLKAEQGNAEQELKELQEKCQVLQEEKKAVLTESEHTKEILSTLEAELGERATDFTKHLKAAKEEARELQHQLEAERGSAVWQLKELEEKCQALLAEKNATLEENNQTKEILRNLEADIGERTADFEMRYDAVKEEIRELQEQLVERNGKIEDGERQIREARGQISNGLMQQFGVESGEAAGGEDDDELPTLLKLLLSRVQDEKQLLLCRLEEHEARLAQPGQERDERQQAPAEAEAEVVQAEQQSESAARVDLLNQRTKDPLETQDTDDMKRLQQQLDEKEALIAQLREELSLLQASKTSTLQDSSQRIETLEKEVKEKDERINKIKAVALKARKDLDSSKKEVCALREELETLRAERDKLTDSMKDVIQGAQDYKNLMSGYDEQSELLDREREKMQAAERQILDLNKRLQQALDQHQQVSGEREDLLARVETLQSNTQQLEAHILDVMALRSALEKDLDTERILKEQKNKEYEAVLKENEDLNSLLHKQKQQLQETEQELEQLRKNAQQSTLLDMEITDMERLVKDLNQQLSEKDSALKEQENLIQMHREKEEKLQQETESLKSLVDTGEEKNCKMKQLLVKTKKDLADAKKEEASLLQLQSSLKEELEVSHQQLEETKIQCSELMAERHRLQEQVKSMCEQHQKTLSLYQLQVNTLQEQLSSTKAELTSVVSEFEGYKVRVHNVLKQQKSRSSTPSEAEFSKQEREQMESVLDQLRSKLQETQLNLQSSSSELQQLQTEHDTLLERHNKMLQQTVTKEAELRERVLSLHSENVALRSEHAQSVSQLTAQADALRSGFREQVHQLQEEHRTTVETLQQQISRLETQLFTLQKDSSSSSGPVPAQLPRKPQADRKLAELAVLELQGMAREEGEGMETTEAENISNNINTINTPPPSLEQLLSSPHPKQEAEVFEVELSKEELSEKLSTATRSMEHVNRLLHESEATNAVLMEQINLLKSELRRLERNQEREKSVANLEYLKNVLLQFMFLRAGSERQALLPVIHTMLQLSPEEKSRLAAIAQGEDEAAAPRASGWTSYLHSWSGIR